MLIAPRAPATFSLEQIVQLFALACEPPEDYGRPISEWTGHELADEMRQAGDCRNYIAASCQTTTSRS